MIPLIRFANCALTENNPAPQDKSDIVYLRYNNK